LFDELLHLLCLRLPSFNQLFRLAHNAVCLGYLRFGLLPCLHAIWFVLRQRFGWASVIYEIKLIANSCIALCSSTNAVSFSSARTTKRFPSPASNQHKEFYEASYTLCISTASNALPATARSRLAHSTQCVELLEVLPSTSNMFR